MFSGYSAPHLERPRSGVDGSTAITARGWGMDPAPLLDVHRRIVADPRGQTALFLASWGGAPAAVAAVELRPRSAFLMGAVVLPEHRGRGLYRALLAARLRAAADVGLTLAVTHAMEATSAPILGRLGFATAARFHYYVDEPTAAAAPAAGA